ncbi:hypothetical protein FACS1894109_04530 [Spirochaetia bacterium]|nr:hypothetical protein FACS1894109_04530 [Spirochaetia bacterium]
MSLRQCLKILKSYPIVFVTHNKLDCTIYDEICIKEGVNFSYEYFPSYYFANLHGYNALLLSKSFYKRFIQHCYILIYQLDVYVFFDQLEHWCNQGYDYIGAPWLDLKEIDCAPVFRVAPIGNGGFSLRKISVFFSNCTKEIQLRSFTHLICALFDSKAKKLQQKILYKIRQLILRLPKKILLKIIFLPNDLDNNEDVIWLKWIISKGAKIPSYHVAMQFSFEDYPEYLFELNNNQLPFGCHRWHIYYHYRFWKPYIAINE